MIDVGKITAPSLFLLLFVIFVCLGLVMFKIISEYTIKHFLCLKYQSTPLDTSSISRSEKKGGVGRQEARNVGGN